MAHHTGVLAALQVSSTQHPLCHLLGVGCGTLLIGQEGEVHTLEIVWIRDCGPGRDAAAARPHTSLRLWSSGPQAPPPVHPCARALRCQHTLIWLDAAPAGGVAGGPQLGFLGGQTQDLHVLCELDGLLQTEQHEVVAVVLSWLAGVVFQEAQVESRVWEVLTDTGELGRVFVLKQVVATQPDLVIAGGRRGWRP